MADQVRTDPQGGMSVTRAPAAKPKSPVVLKADGTYEVRDPSPMALVFASNSVPASASDRVANYSWGTSSVVAPSLPLDAVLVGMSIAYPTSLTGGSVTAKVTRTGSTVPGAQVVLAAPNQRNQVWFGFSAGAVFTPADSFGVTLDTTAAFAPTGQSVLVTLYFAMQP